MGNKAHIIPLAPVNELYKAGNIDRINEFSIYEKYLNAAFEKESINNIAITGNFGVGKSSILQSYDAAIHECRKRFLYVSLSDLTRQNLDSTDKRKLEYSLLCQILAVCEESLLPNSTFQLIPQKKHSGGSLSSISVTTLFSIAYIWTVRDDLFSSIKEVAAQSKILTWIMSNAAFIRIGIHTIFGLLLAYTVYNISKYLSCHRLLKDAKFSGGPIEIETNLAPSRSYLDQYIFELIYALECIASKIDYTVIFEDFDRIDKESCIEIFTKLREINKLVNVRLSPEKHMRFIYVFSDGIFDYTRQTKFFDYCLPVIPVLSSKNAAEELKRGYFGDIQVEDTADIAEAVAPYLTDFRTIHNIINDYRIFEEIDYHRNGKPSNKRKKDLLAFMIYKNLEPQDYDNIRKNNSVVFHGATGELVNGTLIAALQKNNYLSDECLLFVGYSKEQIKLRCLEILKTRSYEEKKNNLYNDKKGLYLEIISNAAQDFIKAPYKDNFSELLHGIEFVFLNYLLGYLVNCEAQEEWSRNVLPNINKILYDTAMFHYVPSDCEPSDTCDNSLRNLFWKFDEEEAYQILRYLYIIGYWNKEVSFDWFFAIQASPLPNASDENKVGYFLRFRKILVEEQLPVPDTIDVAARNWLTSLPSGGIITHWTDRSLIEMIDLLFSNCVPLELQHVEITIDGLTLPVISYLHQYSEDHYWDYSMDRRKDILLMAYCTHGRLPDCFFSQEQIESKYSTDENKVLDFLWLRHHVISGGNNGNTHIPPLHPGQDSINISTKTDLEAAPQVMEESAKQWLSSPGLKDGGFWKAGNLSLPRMIDLLYPTPTDVPGPLKKVRIVIGKNEMLILDFLDQYYTRNYWQYNMKKRIMILLDLIKNGYWNSSLNDSRWFFAGEDASDQDRLQDLLELMGAYSEDIPTELNTGIRNWIDALIEQDIYWHNPDIVQLIDYTYPYGVPTEIRQRELTIRNEGVSGKEKKTIGTYLQDFKFIYYWNYNQNSRLAFLKTLFRERYLCKGADMSWFFRPKELGKFNTDLNKVNDFLALCQWIDEGNGDYQNVIGFLEGGYTWIQTITVGGVTTEWDDDSLIHMILTIRDKLPIEILPKLKQVVLQIGGNLEMLGFLLQEHGKT